MSRIAVFIPLFLACASFAGPDDDVVALRRDARRAPSTSDGGGRGVDPSSWKIRLQAHLPLLKEANSELDKLVPTVARAANRLHQEHKSYLADPTEEKWARLMTVALGELEKIQQAADDILAKEPKLESILLDQLSRLAGQRDSIKKRVKDLSQRGPDLDRRRQQIDRGVADLKLRAREARARGNTLTEEEEEQLWRAFRQGDKLEREKRQAQRDEENARLEARVIGSTRKNLKGVRRRVYVTFNHIRWLSDDVQDTVQKLRIQLKFRESAQALGELDRLGATAERLMSERAAFSRALDSVRKELNEAELPTATAVANETDRFAAWLYETPGKPRAKKETER